MINIQLTQNKSFSVLTCVSKNTFPVFVNKYDICTTIRQNVLEARKAAAAAKARQKHK